ncbi:CaiB/BaiF CoA-transferase family protein [Conexibacter sp. CPCC 206217]|uniref:CaiB/BaiF CoA transferase family protein n=1 Tax=Conexibacter sp. CPCC 206217 TaxID=3064574 RepID=UPI00271A450B|nr:CoA transferase [Conexibacter sp. CPCC 206217]MDO8212234.1 CoA transferase [Conexibacter sp. CPCC 206217]
MSSEQQSGGPLEGIRVVDLTHALAGPFATMLLADLGADVIKVEPPHGDVTRTLGPYADEDELRAFGGYFNSVNRGKRGIVIDLKTAEGVEELLALVRGADALVENFTVGVMDRLGLSYERLRAENPRLVYASTRGFGDPRGGESPYAHRPSMDLVAQAMGGVLGITGTVDGTPIKVGPGVGDIFPGTLTTVGVLAAIVRARATGEGQYVDVAMYDAVLSLCERIVYQYSYRGEVPVPQGNGHPMWSPFDVVRAKDGWVVVCAPTPPRWRRLCTIMGQPELIDDPRFRTIVERVEHRDEVKALLTAWTSVRTKREVVDELGDLVPAAPVNTVVDIFEDPHVRARDMLVEIDHPGMDRTVTVAGQPIKFSETPAGVHGRAPLLDEHGDEIRAELAAEAAAAASSEAASNGSVGEVDKPRTAPA